MTIFRCGSTCSAVVLVLVLLQYTSTVFTQPFPAICANYAAEGDCRFYSECVESRVPCGEEEYALGYGRTYCNRFFREESFDNDLVRQLSIAILWITKLNSQGREWVNDVQSCLTGAINRSDVYATPTDDPDATTCFNLRKLAFDSHSKCYFDHGFCSRIANSPRNLNGLFNVLQYGDDFPGPYWRQAWTQVIKL